MALDLCDRPTRTRLRPQRRGNEVRVDAASVPPGGFTAAAVDLAVVDAAKRHRELVADFAAERSRLCGAQMMGIRGLPPTDQAGLRGDEFKVLLVADAARLADCQHAFIDATTAARSVVDLSARAPGRLFWGGR
jgi:hypothetical protein